MACRVSCDYPESKCPICDTNTQVDLDYQGRVFDMVCEQHASDRVSTMLKDSGTEHVAPSVVQMEA